MNSLDELKAATSAQLDTLTGDELAAAILLVEDARQTTYNRWGGKIDDVAEELEKLTNLVVALRLRAAAVKRIAHSVTD